MIEQAATVVIVAAVVAGFVLLARDDARTSEVVVVHARAVTAVAVLGLGAVGLITGRWGALISAAAAAALVTTVQLVPYLAQRRRRAEWIGRADVRLALPFGWTLGYFGVGFAVVGFAVALLGGLIAAGVTRRRRVPFVPFLALGLVVGLAWAALVTR